MKKLFNITAIILIIFFAGYFVHNEFIVKEDNALTPDKQATKQTDAILPEETAPAQAIKQPEAVNETTLFLNSIGKETQMNFSAAEEKDFEWILNDDSNKVTIKGEAIFARTTLGNSEKVDDYFRASGFVMDRYNLADGTISSRTGFKKGQMVCTRTTRSEDEEFTVPTESMISNIEINCGILDAELSARATANPPEPIVNKTIKDEEIVETDEEAITRIFKQQYPDYGAGEEIIISCNKKTTAHARCMAVFTGAYSAPYFLAVKINGSWIIPFIGQDAPLCVDIEPYNFPISMVPECWDSENKKWKKRDAPNE